LALDYGDRLAAAYGTEWSFPGLPREGELGRFQGLAIRGALELGCVAPGRAVAFWLDALRAASPPCTNGPVVSHFDGRGGCVTVQHHLIEDPCKVSAEYCLRLASQQDCGEAAGQIPEWVWPLSENS